MLTINQSLIFALAIFVLIFNTKSQGQLYKLVLTSQERGAACLDGSSTGFYLHEGFGQNKNNFLVYFEGGGFCGQSTLSATLQNCYKRSFTVRGSSKVRPTTFNTTGYGFLSTLQKQNPYFYDWTKVIVIYCDGHQYAGHRQIPIQYRDRKLYFRGSRNVKQIFYHLNQKHNLYNAGKIVMSGGSAGGICTFQWSNFLFENADKAKVYAMPDSGFFITDYESPILGRKILREVTEPLFNMVYNETQMPEPISKCMKEPGFDIVDCFNVANYAQFLKAPLFMIQSPYDEFSLKNIVGASCITNKDEPYSIETCNKTTLSAIDDYRLKSIDYLNSMRRSVKTIGVWGPACVQHCYAHEWSYNDSNYQVNGHTLMEAINMFIENPTKGLWLLDEKPWPQNIGCNGLNKSQLSNFNLLKDH